VARRPQLGGVVTLQRWAVADEDDLGLERGELADRGGDRRHVHGELRVRTANMSVDGVGEGVAGDQHRRVGIEHPDVAVGVAGGGEHLQSEHPLAVGDRLQPPA
jgi:hypothetical protein